MARPAGDGRLTCESCQSIDVREWARRGCLRPGQRFSWSWSCDGEPFGSITLRTAPAAVPGEVVLRFRSRGSVGSRWRSVEQRVSISWTKCHLGGCRTWFSSTACGRRVAKLYDGAGELFACRHCCGLA